ncbi:hypothetical protein GA0070558_15030 [Micromonospora haikouensis]|uniref:Uncharacterized protein n=1 Tax=Micromonospora haikouensis TaxID=686309 RepID=A0A1C4YKF5_9ACTN|nr:hypothetical protein [Micromonospora haikouensis]SCF20821.1 hypothetical protein GA0070558_15030 [Micromonospora haikouensis]
MPTFEVEVISDPIRLVPNNGFDFNSPWLRESPGYDTRLVKPAILFADHVNLVSSRSTVHHFIGMHGWRILNMPMRQMNAFLNLSIERDPADLENLGLTADDLANPEEASTVNDAMRRCDTNEELRHAFSTVVIPFFERHSDQSSKMVEAFSRLWRDRHEMLIAPDLAPAIDRQVLTVQGWVEDLPPQERMFLANEEFLEESFAGMLERLQDPRRLALMDPSIAAPEPNVNYETTPTPAFLGNAIVSRIQGLDDLPMIEVLDLREELKDYLPHFRSEIVSLSQDVAQMTSSQEIAAELDLRWYRDIAPAMEEIRREIATARYPRRLVDALTSDPATIASGAGALTIAAGGLAIGLSALLPAVAAAAYPFLKAKALRDQGLEKAQTNKLFFLYALQNRLSTGS